MNFFCFDLPEPSFGESSLTHKTKQNKTKHFLIRNKIVVQQTNKYEKKKQFILTWNSVLLCVMCHSGQTAFCGPGCPAICGQSNRTDNNLIFHNTINLMNRSVWLMNVKSLIVAFNMNTYPPPYVICNIQVLMPPRSYLSAAAAVTGLSYVT